MGAPYRQAAGRGKKETKVKTETFMPYNKSILTRVIAPLLQSNNVTVFSHHTKRALQTYLKQPISGIGYQPVGPARGMFGMITKLGLDTNRLTRSKINNAQSLKKLQKNFKGNLNDINK